MIEQIVKHHIALLFTEPDKHFTKIRSCLFGVHKELYDIIVKNFSREGIISIFLKSI